MNEQLQKQSDKPESGSVEFVPYGAADRIKLSIKIVQDLIAVPTKSGKTCGNRDALKFIAMCQAKRLNPFEGDAFLIGFDGKNGPEFNLVTAHQAFLKRAELHPEFDGMRSGVIVADDNDKLSDIEGDFYAKDQKPVGGWATVYFKTRKIPTTRRIRLERFNNGYAQWAVDAAGMIVKCAEADALRSSFPTMLGGMYMADEITIDIGPSVEREATRIDRTPKFTPGIEDRREQLTGDGTDLGPVKSGNSRGAKTAAQPEPVPVNSTAPTASDSAPAEVSTGEPQLSDNQQGICNELTAAGVEFEQLQSYVRAYIPSIKGYEDWTGYMGIREEACLAIMPHIAKIVKRFGSKS